MTRTHYILFLFAAILLHGIYSRYSRPDPEDSPDSLYRDAAHFPIQSRWLRSRGANCSPTRSCKHSLPDARLAPARDRIGKIQAVVHLYHALGGGKE